MTTTADSWHLAELNIARLLHPLESEEIAEFRNALGPINSLAEVSPGYIWRLIGDDGFSTGSVDVPGAGDDKLIVNLSVWTDVESLFHYVMKSGHVTYFRRRKEWMEANVESATVCWWIPAGTLPTLDDAFDRLAKLNKSGPSEDGWPIQERRQPPLT